MLKLEGSTSTRSLPGAKIRSETPGWFPNLWQLGLGKPGKTHDEPRDLGLRNRYFRTVLKAPRIITTSPNDATPQGFQHL